MSVVQGASAPDRQRWARIRALRSARPRSRLLRASGWLLAVLVLYAWLGGEVDLVGLFGERRLDNVGRFLREDALPFPLRESGFELAGLFAWAGEVLADRGLSAMGATLWISLLSIALAGALALGLAPFATGTLMTREPYLVTAESRGRRPLAAPGFGWRILCAGVRALFVLLRAIPEYVLAFLLLAMLGASAWPVVIALALHNGGILGRLTSETLENLDRAPMRSLRMSGATRLSITWGALWPLGLGRFLLYFFYRFETCVREATVLGMLGVVSLGFWIQDARARQHYDDMLLLVALGGGLVLLADVISILARAWIRRA